MKKIVFLAFTLIIATSIHAQNEVYPSSADALAKKIIGLDSQAFDAYNKCDTETFRTFFTDDLEFYHDKGGYSKGIDKFIETFKNNLCNESKPKIIRKPVNQTLKVYPLDGYSAILMGDHDFYSLENGKEKKTGTAKFTHVWLLQNGAWKMARVLSYDHKASQ
ncbi:MAG: nuclear transport factor 2 family protein [Flavobacterium psychrophilum]|nr:MAG: nuclear transport factor 2 family protein [Flavobacterium psychrophilum]